MSKRNTVSDNFEICYLKANCARRAFANKDEVAKLMSEKDFEKCVKYIANMTFTKNRQTLLRHGFDFEDILSIAKVFGTQFVNSEFEGATKKDTYYVLMRFVGQRFETFMLFMDRKFRISERHAEISTEDMPDLDFYKSDSNITEAAASTPTGALARKVAAVRNRITDFKTDLLRLRLDMDIDKHVDRLAEIATSKSVEFAVRKKARAVCKKKGIDYLGWAKKQIKLRNLSESDFALK